MKRRSFGKLIVIAGTSMMAKNSWSERLKVTASDIELPKPVTGQHSVEKCLNSRVSKHSGYSGTLNQQILANACWAASKAPLMGSSRLIHVATPDAVYNYNPAEHKLIVHISGNKLSESTLAFEIGIATNPAGLAEDAGAALHWAHLAAVSFLGSTSDKPVCCPKDSGYTHANQNWNLSTNVHLVNCYGKMASAGDFQTNVVAVSSDNSLPTPLADGSTILEDAMQEPFFGDSFTAEDLSLEQISQLAWAAYGCTPHSISSKAGLTVASWNALYYITGRIYIVRSGSVDKFHMRQPSGTVSTRDHRIAQSVKEDRRAQLRNAATRISKSAPVYFVFCAETTERPQLLEAGYCGSSALLQATALGLQGHYCGGFSDSERVAIQNALGIPGTDKPLVVFAAGKPSESSINRHIQRRNLKFSVHPNPFADRTEITVYSQSNQQICADVHDLTGKRIRTLIRSSLPQSGIISWDGRNDRGKPVATGTYICKISAANTVKSILLHKK